MKNKILRMVAFSASMGLSSWVMAGSSPSMQEMWERIQKQQEEIEQLKSRLAEPPASATAPATTESKESVAAAPPANAWTNTIKLSGKIEIEGRNARSFNDVHSSGVYLAKMELAVDAALNEWFTGHINLKHEDGAPNELDLDEGTITAANPAVTPLYLSAGRMYLPMGIWTTNHVTDTLPQQMGETRAYNGAVRVGYKDNGFDVSLFGFKGQFLVNNQQTMDEWGGNVSYNYEGEPVKIKVGLTYINALEESKSMTRYFINQSNFFPTGMSSTSLTGHTPALGAYFNLAAAGFTLIGEYVGATKEFDPRMVAWHGHGAQPKAWNAELDYTWSLMGKDTTVGVGYQVTSQALGFALSGNVPNGGTATYAPPVTPEKRYIASISRNLFDNTTLTFEYAYDKDYSTSDWGWNPGAGPTGGPATNNGTGQSANSAKLKLAVKF